MADCSIQFSDAGHFVHLLYQLSASIGSFVLLTGTTPDIDWYTCCKSGCHANKSLLIYLHHFRYDRELLIVKITVFEDKIHKQMLCQSEIMQDSPCHFFYSD